MRANVQALPRVVRCFDFNSRPRMRANDGIARGESIEEHFNSRPRMRANRRFRFSRWRSPHFNSRPRMRANLKCRSTVPTVVLFQLPPSHEGEPRASADVYTPFYISTPALA